MLNAVPCVQSGACHGLQPCRRRTGAWQQRKHRSKQYNSAATAPKADSASREGSPDEPGGPTASASQAVVQDLLQGPQRSIHTAAELATSQLQLSVQDQASSNLGGLSAAAVAAANEATVTANRADIYKVIGISGVATVLAGILDHSWVDDHVVRRRRITCAMHWCRLHEQTCPCNP